MSKLKIWDNKLRIVAKYPLGYYPTGENKKLVVQTIEFDYFTTLEDVFSQFPSCQNVYALYRYYRNLHWSSYGNACPYIVSKNTAFWDVPYNQAKVIDFLGTHDIYDNIIEIEVDCLAGGGDLYDILLQGWMICKILLESAGYVFTFKKILEIIFNTFGKNKKKIPAFDTVEMYLLKEDCWDIKELNEQTRFPKPFLQAMLVSIGFDEHDGKYYKNSWKVEEFQREKDRIEYNEYIKDYNGFDSSIGEEWSKPINSSLIYLYQISYMVDGGKTYDAVSKRIQEMISEEDHDEFYNEELEYIQDQIKIIEDKLGII